MSCQIDMCQLNINFKQVTSRHVNPAQATAMYDRVGHARSSHVTSRQVTLCAGNARQRQRKAGRCTNGKEHGEMGKCKVGGQADEAQHLLCPCPCLCLNQVVVEEQLRKCTFFQAR